ncbi:MAG: bifunctional DNA-formamidopyrimidine glycosylase/DNA-(apurinic or apyrimidinic site) lyase [Pirellulaceae bacterium]|nr:bifunctional DNA-formamidopyrimidine glycosylase/DNA-(apurinic or apyrimidinic site) lyase [Thermoguttaceae bacterium]MDI9445820.1 bifunctional DNA-formamidopyrimidine glycosylase/DNA-(apurinic or apyrimidinic site) lyase [Planctomycetota bacterium]NLZ03390.1 bifunctional DNA-formamidopyrimidine glycosylase/DNA-(apurinic or apyrimidinic site) lyase [Pirellulaceae bacterium]
MPELPEVETMCRGIAAVAGRRIHALRFPKSPLRSIPISPRPALFRRRVEGRSITAVRRVGKRVVLDLDSSAAIVFEPRMSGRVHLACPPDAEHVRAVLEFADGPGPLIFWSMRGLSTLCLLTARELAQRLGPDRLGPDALRIGADALRARLQASRRAIKVALLDQRAVAGIGNIYASEILHRIGVHPETSCDRLSPRQWKRMQAATVGVLSEAIAAQGSTLRDGRYRTTRGEPGRFQDKHRVYGRAGLKCLQCGRGRIRKIVQAQRSTYYCPICQRGAR